MSLPPQQVLSEAERALTDAGAGELWRASVAMVSAEPMPKAWIPMESLSVALSAVLEQADRAGLSNHQVLEVMAKQLGCQIAYRAEESEQMDLLLAAGAWIARGVEAGLAGEIERDAVQ